MARVLPTDSLHWDKNKIFSYNALFTFVIGARGVGKTFRMKYDAIKRFIASGERCYWVMRYRTELDDALAGGKFFEDVKEFFPDSDFKVVGNLGMIDVDGAGEFVPFITFKALSESSIKAISDPMVSYMVFDEFLPIKGVRYLKGEVTRLLELYNTISRDRDIRLVFLGNNVTISSPYFQYFHCSLPREGQITFKNDIAIENVKNTKYTEHMYETRFGKLVKGTAYAEYAIENKTMEDLNTFITKMPPKSRCIVGIDTDQGKLYLWLNKSALIISTKGNDNGFTWAIGDSQHGEGKERVDFAGSYATHMISRHYRCGTLLFDSAMAKAVFMQTCGVLLGGRV